MMSKTISVNTVKIQNRLAVFRELRNFGETTRTQLARRCNLSLGTVVTILEELAGQGVVEETLDQRATVGRKPHLVRLVDGGKRIIAIDLSSRNSLYEIFPVHLQGGVGAKHRFRSAQSLEANVRALFEEVRRHVEDLRIKDEDIIGIGVSVPGSYRYTSDSIENAPFPELHQIGLNRLLKEYFDQPVTIDHDVFLAAHAEIRYISAYHDKNIFYMFLGEGVGGALSAHGELYRGSREDAGDIGRMYITADETLEDLVSWNRVEAALAVEGTTPLEAQSPDGSKGSAATEGPPRDLPAPVQEATRVIARALQNTFWVVDPDCFVVGGEYQRFGTPFVELITRELQRYLEPSVMETLEVRLSQHGARGALLGAAQIARRQWLVSL